MESSRRRGVLRTAGIVFALSTIAFGWIAHEVADGDHVELEVRALQALRPGGVPLGPAGTEDAVRDITALGSGTMILTCTVMIVGYLLLVRKHQTALLLVVAIAGGQLLNLGLKNSFARARPEAVAHLTNTRQSSFPSGHSMAASIFYLTIGTLLARTLAHRREKIYLMACCLLLIAAIGVSRAYLGVHYPSDILAGWMAGAAWASLCWGVSYLWKSK